MKIACEICGKIFELSKHVQQLPCGHALDEQYFISRETYFKVEGLVEDGMNLGQAIDALCRSSALRYNKIMGI
jgi:hypothetical protein